MQRSQLSAKIRNQLVRMPPPHDAAFGVVPARPPTSGLWLGDARDRHAEAVAALDEVAALQRSLPNGYLVSRTLSRREAVSSSAIEGTQSTLDELLASEEGDEGVTRATAQVRDYARVLETHLPAAAAAGPRYFTLDRLLDLHRAVMAADPDFRGRPGMLRETAVWIGGTGHIATSTFNPPPPDHVAACLEDTADYLRNDGEQQLSQSLLTRMAVAHAHFEAVHPFIDGNGRMGRILWPLMMAAVGVPTLYLSPYVEAHRSAYYDALKAAQQRERWDALVAFLADAVIGTVAELKATLADLSTLSETWLGQVSAREGSAARRALPLLASYPVLTVKRLETMLQVSTPTANAAVEQLETAGILTERTGYRRNRVFVAVDVLAILNRPFGEPHPIPAST